jgi:signal transduction histidine kinase
VRRSLILTVAAAVSMVLLAMLVPMAVLLRSYALEDRLTRAALEVQATETVVAGQEDPGAVVQYLDRINRGTGIETTVLYPGDSLDTDIGPDPGEDAHVKQVRLTGTARIDDIPGGAEFLVPVSTDGGTAAAEQTAVIRVVVDAPGFESDLVRSWSVLLLLGLVLLVGALFLADRLGRSFVTPIRGLAEYAARLGSSDQPEPLEPSGPPEVRELSAAMARLVDRIEVLLERERAGVADLSHRLRTPLTALRLRAEQLEPADARRVGSDLDELEAMVDLVVRESRRSAREGLVAGADVVAVVQERVLFWRALAEDQGRELALVLETSGPVLVRASQEDLTALVDVLLDNVFTHVPDDAPIGVTVLPRDGGGAVVLVDDGGPGFPEGLAVLDRGTSGAGSSGLGLAIAERTAVESGGGLSLGVSPYAGGRVRVELGPPT